jgi:D-alanyl-D-alanine carboxypeptidase (penicillin-binding protein 5/6)
VRAPRAILTGAVVALAAGGGLTGCGDAGGGTKGAAAAAPPAAPLQIANGPITPGTGPRPLAVNLADPRDPVDPHFKRPPRAGLLFDLDTGRVLWRRNPTRALPIASLTKMMTALIVADRLPAGTKVRVTKEALAYHGSGVGVLPKGKSVGVSAMLYGLLLPSGNDAAIALAQRTSGTVARFVTRMNAEAASLGLQCSHFSSPSGFVDAGNSSCPLDLAALSRAILDQPRLARIVGRRQAVLPFPIKGGKLFLNNNNPLLRTGYPGTIGIKTGYTDAAGRCLVAAVTRRGRRLGVVLLHSIDPGRQARVLFDRGLQEVAPR